MRAKSRAWKARGPRIEYNGFNSEPPDEIAAEVIMKAPRCVATEIKEIAMNSPRRTRLSYSKFQKFCLILAWINKFRAIRLSLGFYDWPLSSKPTPQETALLFQSKAIVSNRCSCIPFLCKFAFDRDACTLRVRTHRTLRSWYVSCNRYLISTMEDYSILKAIVYSVALVALPQVQKIILHSKQSEFLIDFRLSRKLIHSLGEI